MALINCPECGGVVSDKGTKCPKCGYMLKKEESGNEAAQTMDFPGQAQPGEEPEDREEEASAKKPDPKKNLKLKAAVAGIAAIAVIFAAAIFINGASGKVWVKEVKLDRWEMVDQGDPYNTYEGTVTSDTTEPFVAVIGPYSAKTLKAPRFVFMEEGKGIIRTTEMQSDDPSRIYEPIGYISGKRTKKSDFKKLEYVIGDYTDLVTTSCEVSVYIEMDKKAKGVLLCDISNDRTEEVLRDRMVPIVDGGAQFTEELKGLPLKSRGVEVTITPKMFCKASELKESE